MKTTTITGILTVLTPLHHGGDEKSGAERLLRRIKYVVNGELIDVPYIDGNAIRGYLRRLIMQDLLDRVDYQPQTEKLYYSLFSGGVLEEVTTQEHGKLDLELRRLVRSLIPPLSIFGTSILNQAFTGKLIVGKALPICRELNNYLPIQSDRSFYEFLDFTFGTRRDDLKARSDEEQAVQMIYSYEVFIPGTRLYHTITLMDYNRLEASCLKWLINLWRSRPFIGGRTAIGNGELDIKYDFPDTWPSDDEYVKYVEDKRLEIVELLRRLDEILGGKRK